MLSIEGMDSTPGQRLLSSLVDVAFFVLIGVLAYRGRLAESSILPILLMYARDRFAVAQQKQWVQMVGPGAGGGNGPSSVRPPTAGPQSPTTPPQNGETTQRRALRVSPSRIVDTVRRYVRHPPAIGIAAILTLIFVAHGYTKDAPPEHPIPPPAAVVCR